MLEVVLICTATVLSTILIHHEGLLAISAGASRLAIGRTRIVMMGVVIGILGLHLIEILLYAGAIYLSADLLHLGRLVGDVDGTDLEVLYFSAETYTSLGFGDILPTGSMRLLASLEPLNGLLLLGWSATFIHVEVDRFWRRPPSGANGGVGSVTAK